MSRRKIKKPKSKAKPLSLTEKGVLSLILQNKSIEDICSHTELDIVEIVKILTSLMDRLPKSFKDAYIKDNGKQI